MQIAAENSGVDAPRFNWTIAHKIGGLASVLILFILALLIYSIITLKGIQGEIKEIAELDVPMTELASHIEIEHLETQITIDQILLFARGHDAAYDPEKLNALDKQLHEHAEAMDRYIAAGERLSATGSALTGNPMFKKISGALTELEAEARIIHKEMFAFSDQFRAGQKPSSDAIDALIAREVAFDHKIIALLESIEAFTERQIKTLEHHERVFFWVNTSLAGAGVGLGVVLSIIVIVGIRTNLFRLTAQVTEVASAISEKREINPPAADVNTNDEIGRLAANLTNMIDNVSTDIREREELADKLQHAATTDRLTGAFNRLNYEEDIETETERARRSGKEFSVILFDIDHFKKVNDTYGHDVGDEVLIEVARTVSGAIRKSDAFYRIGGEEFIVLTPATGREYASLLAEKIRLTLEMQTFDHVGQVTLSMGCAQFDPAGEDDAAQLYKRADLALYEAKEGGRNRVCLEAAA